MSNADQIPTFKCLLQQVFNAYGAEYHSVQEDSEAVELTLESGQSIVFTESEDHQLVMIAELGDCPSEPETLILLLRANHQGLNPENPHNFFIDPNSNVCVSISYPLANAQLNKVQQALEHLIHCCQWFLTLTLEAANPIYETDAKRRKLKI